MTPGASSLDALAWKSNREGRGAKFYIRRGFLGTLTWIHGIRTVFVDGNRRSPRALRTHAISGPVSGDLVRP